MNTIKFILKRKVRRKHAMQWLSVNFRKFPNMDGADIGSDKFHGWRFIRGTDGIVYFANCIEPGISEEQLYQFLSGINLRKRIGAYAKA